MDKRDRAGEGPWELSSGWAWNKLSTVLPLQYGKALTACLARWRWFSSRLRLQRRGWQAQGGYRARKFNHRGSKRLGGICVFLEASLVAHRHGVLHGWVGGGRYSVRLLVSDISQTRHAGSIDGDTESQSAYLQRTVDSPRPAPRTAPHRGTD